MPTGVYTGRVDGCGTGATRIYCSFSLDLILIFEEKDILPIHLFFTGDLGALHVHRFEVKRIAGLIEIAAKERRLRALAGDLAPAPLRQVRGPESPLP